MHAADGVAGTLRVIAIIGAAALLVWALADVVLLVFMAALLAIILRGISGWLAERTGAPLKVMLAVVTLAVSALLAGLVFYIGPRLVTQTQALFGQINQTIEHLRQDYGNTAWGHLLLQHLSPEQLMNGSVFGSAGALATSTLGGVVSAFVLVVTALYFAVAPDLYVEGIVRLFAIPYRPRARAALEHVGITLRLWSLGQLIDMIAVGVLTGIGLALLGLPLALALAVLAGLLTFVPYFGAIAAAIPAVLIAFAEDWRKAVWVAVIFTVAHVVEGYVISPLVQRNTADLPPAVTILSMTILGALFGTLGVILGAPVAAAVLVLVREVYVAGVLGDADVERVDAPGGGTS